MHHRLKPLSTGRGTLGFLLHMTGQGIPSPSPPDTSQRVGAIPPVPSIHRLVIDRSQGGRRRTSVGLRRMPRHVALDATGAVSAPLISAPGGWCSRPLKAPTWPPCGGRARASGTVQPLGPERYDEVPRARRGGVQAAAPYAWARPLCGEGARHTRHTGRAFFPPIPQTPGPISRTNSKIQTRPYMAVSCQN